MNSVSEGREEGEKRESGRERVVERDKGVGRGRREQRHRVREVREGGREKSEAVPLLAQASETLTSFPIMVYVLPLPVCPYANMQVL